MDAIDTRAVWSTAYMNNLPDSAFLYIEPGGKKDSEGKTTPRSLRHFPYKDANGNVDLAHLRNALSRIPQSNLPANVKTAATKKAQGILAKQGGSDNDADDRATSNEFALRYVDAPLTHLDVREPSETTDGSWTASGYAAVFNQETTLHDGALARVTETIDPHAFDRVLAEQGITTPGGVIHLNLGHDMNRCVAATDVPAGQPGNLQLRPDAHGLYFLARIAKDDPDGQALVSKLRSGVSRQASFAMKIGRIEPTTRSLPDGRIEDHQLITEISRVRDICVAAQGAYSNTTVHLRTMAAALGEPIWDALPREPDLGRGAVELGIARDGGVARRPPLDALIAPRQRQHIRSKK